MSKYVKISADALAPKSPERHDNTGQHSSLHCPKKMFSSSARSETP